MYVCMYVCMSHNLCITLGCRCIADFNGDGAEEGLPEEFLKVEILEDTSDPAKLFSELFVSPLR
jgi:hypothetical protein